MLWGGIISIDIFRLSFNVTDIHVQWELAAYS